MNLYLCTLHLFGGIFAVLNGIQIFNRDDAKEISELRKIIAKKNKIIADYELMTLKQQAIIDYDSSKRQLE